MKLYHASPFIIEQPDVFHSREHLDFGRGFYLTTLSDQARKYGLRFLLRGRKAFLNEYVLEDELSAFKVKTFDCYDGEWLDFVGKCRKGIQEELFDIVSGGIADDKVFNTIDLYFAGVMSRSDALGKLAFVHPNHQLCILNQEVITKHLRFVGAEEITIEEDKNASR